MSGDRVILHVDMDAFFASVEQLDDPSLRGKPVLVGGTGPRAVVAAASYESRRYGCHSAMPMSQALRLCPQAVVVRGSFARYRELSDRVMSILESFTPMVEPVSIDEAYMDVTGSAKLFGDGRAIGVAVRARILEETGLTASVGVGPNPFIAKLASDMDKPDGLTVIEPERVLEVLGPMPVSRIPGVGPAAERALARLGLRTIEQVRGAPEEMIVRAMGGFGESLVRKAWGRSDRIVSPDHSTKSVGHEQTFGVDAEDPEFVRGVMLGQCEQVARRLRRKSLKAGGVTVKIRYGDFETITRNGMVPVESRPTDSAAVLYDVAREVFDGWASRSFRPVRLIGVSARELAGGGEEQLGLFGGGERAEKLAKADRAADAIVEKFGAGSIGRAASIERGKGRGGQREEWGRRGDEGGEKGGGEGGRG